MDRIKEIVIFGDSLSDTGNFVAAKLGNLHLGPVLTRLPGPKGQSTPFWKPQSYCFRFTDGWAWPDYLWYHCLVSFQSTNGSLIKNDYEPYAQYIDNSYDSVIRTDPYPDILVPSLNAFVRNPPEPFNYTVLFHTKNIINYSIGGTVISNESHRLKTGRTERNVLPTMDRQIDQYHLHKDFIVNIRKNPKRDRSYWGPNFFENQTKESYPHYHKLGIYWAGANDLFTLFGTADKRGLMKIFEDRNEALTYIHNKALESVRQILHLWNTGDFSQIFVFNQPTIEFSPEMNLYYGDDSQQTFEQSQNVSRLFNSELNIHLRRHTRGICEFSENEIINPEMMTQLHGENYSTSQFPSRGIVLVDINQMMLRGLTSPPSPQFQLLQLKNGGKEPATLFNLKNSYNTYTTPNTQLPMMTQLLKILYPNPEIRRDAYAPIATQQLDVLIERNVIDLAQKNNLLRQAQANEVWFAFWDGLHPSSLTHNLIAEGIFDKLIEAHNQHWLDLTDLIHAIKRGQEAFPRNLTLLKPTKTLKSDMTWEQREAAIWQSTVLRGFWGSDQISRQQRENFVWQKDAEAAVCQQCFVPFSLTFRRHHCRVCGLIFCHNCSKNISVPIEKLREIKQLVFSSHPNDLNIINPNDPHPPPYMQLQVCEDCQDKYQIH